MTAGISAADKALGDQQLGSGQFRIKSPEPGTPFLK
jgi:hypothetical protein